MCDCKIQQNIIFFPQNTGVTWDYLGTYDNASIDQCKEKKPVLDSLCGYKIKIRKRYFFFYNLIVYFFIESYIV